MEPRATGLASGPAPLEGSTLRGKQLQLLATKVIPPRCPGLIERPRLLGVTSQLSEKRLAVLKAPVGFGKTSLAVSWFQRLQQSGNAVAWLTIYPDHDEPPTFLFYVAHALQRACEGVSAAAIDLIQETFLINPRVIMSTLMNDLADVDDEVYLILEDYHLVANFEIHEALAFFLKRAPSHCHVVLTTRTEPPLPLASLCAQNKLLEIDESAFRFDLQETWIFLETENPGTLFPSDVRILHEKTEGWPAALRIAASTSIQSRQDFGQYVRNLSGTQRPISTYLGELLDGVPRELIQFMLRTAILDRLCAPLCEHVTGTSSSRKLLASIEKRQLLLVPLDREGQWYRYHSLLAEYLTKRLEAEFGNEISGLHQRASLWYASEEMWTDAVQHAIAAGDSVRALSWNKNCAMASVKQSDFFTSPDWQPHFPDLLMRSQPEPGLATARGRALAMGCDETLELLGEIDRDIGANSSRDDEAIRYGCDTGSVAIALTDDGGAAPSTDPWTANVASNVVRFGHLKNGDFKKFYRTPWIPNSLDEDRRNVFASVYHRCIQGMAELQQLHIASADGYFHQGLQLAEQHVGPNSVVAALPASLIARVRYEQGRLNEAEAMLIDRMSFINAGAMLDCMLSAYWIMPRIAAHRMNLERAHTLLEWAESQGNARGWGRLTAGAMLARVRLYLSEGRTGEGAGCLERLGRLAAHYKASNDCAWSDIHRYVALARAYLASAEGRFDRAISILSGLQRELEGVQNLFFALRVETHLATVRFRNRRTFEALDSFGGTVARLAPAGFYQTILDEGAEIGPLLAALQENPERTRRSPELASYISKLAAAWGSRFQAAPQQTRTSRIAESLTAREGAILRLIAEGLSNKEIARKLAIGPETVKTHVKHIFIKLNVEKRTEAVFRARSLGWLVTDEYGSSRQHGGLHRQGNAARQEASMSGKWS
jgi:LuxR family maltose regulon positive regulatory protein